MFFECSKIVRLICVNIYERIVAVRIIIRIDINDIYFENNSLYIRCLHKEESVCEIIFIKHLAHSKNTFYLCTIKRTIKKRFFSLIYSFIAFYI